MDNPFETKPIVCLYHADCLDGFAAAYVVWKHFKEHKQSDITIRACKYEDNLNKLGILELVAGRDVYIVDFSFPPEELIKICAVARRVILMDHHESAIRALEDKKEELALVSNLTLITDVNRSGAGIVWDYFYPDQAYSPLVSYVQDRDLWKFRWADTKAICAYLAILPWNLEAWYAVDMELRDADKLEYLQGIGLALLEQQKKQVLALCVPENIRYVSLYSYPGLIPMVNAPYFLASETGHYLAGKNSAGIAGTYTINADGLARVSLRSIDNRVNCAKIAEYFGGGGHPGAAGFIQHIRILLTD